MLGRKHFFPAKQRAGAPLPQPHRSLQGFQMPCPQWQEGWRTNTGQSEPDQPLPQPHTALEAPDSLKLHPLMIAVMIFLAQVICKTLEQVPSSSTEHVVGSSKAGTCHVLGMFAVFMLWLQKSDTLNDNCFDISHSYSMFHQINFKALSRTPL